MRKPANVGIEARTCEKGSISEVRTLNGWVRTDALVRSYSLFFSFSFCGAGGGVGVVLGCKRSLGMLIEPLVSQNAVGECRLASTKISLFFLFFFLVTFWSSAAGQ